MIQPLMIENSVCGETVIEDVVFTTENTEDTEKSQRVETRSIKSTNLRDLWDLCGQLVRSATDAS
jgi:hypothetical protein